MLFRFLQVILLVSILGCSNGDRSVFVDFPAMEGAKTLVLGLFGPVSEPRIVVFDLEQQGSTYNAAFDLIDDESVVLEAVGYSIDHQRLGLEPGVIQPRDKGVSLPAASVAGFFEARADDAGATEWSTRATMPDRIGRMPLLPEHNPCASFTRALVELPVPGRILSIIPIANDTIIVSVSGEQTFLVHPDGSIEPFVFTAVTSLYGWVKIEDTIWVGGNGGHLMTLNPSTLEVSTATITPDPLTFFWIDGGRRTDGEIEIFAVTPDGLFGRWSESSWEVFHDFFEGELNYRGGVAWLGTDLALAGHSTKSTALRYDAGRLIPEKESGLELGIDVLRRIDGLGIVAVTEQFLLLEDDHWRSLGHATSKGIEEVGPFRDGFVFTGTSGLVGEYMPSFGFCEPKAVFGTVDHVQELPNGDLVAGIVMMAGNEPGWIAWLTME